MKILIVTTKFWPAVGGLEMTVKNCLAHYLSAGHRILVVTNRYSRKLKAREQVNGVEVYRYFFTDRPPVTSDLWIWFKYFVRVTLIPWSFFRLMQILIREKPDVVHLHFVGSPSWYVLLAKKMLRFPLVVSLHGSDVELYPFKPITQKWLLRKTLDVADQITANASHLLDEALVMTRRPGHRVKARVVPMGFSYDDFKTETPPYRHAKPYMFAAGRFVLKKGFDILVRAFEKVVKSGLYQGDLIVAGEGPEFAACVRLAKELNIQDRVLFPGTAGRAQMVSFMKGADLIIVSSRLEAFGIIVLEALYSGKPVLASCVGGIPELMADNREWLVPPGDPDRLAAKIMDVLGGRLKWVPVSARSLQEKFNWQRVTEDYLGVYRQVIAS